MKRLHVAISALGYTRHKYDRCTKLRSVNGGGRPLGKTGRPCKFGELEDLFAAVHAQHAAVANFDLDPVTMRAIIAELVAARVHAGLCSVDTSVTSRDANHYIKTCCANRKGFAVNGKKKAEHHPTTDREPVHDRRRCARFADTGSCRRSWGTNLCFVRRMQEKPGFFCDEQGGRWGTQCPSRDHVER